ncbi:MAG: hypothetical protein ABW110_06080 [Steroidobacteraceae bacterium]
MYLQLERDSQSSGLGACVVPAGVTLRRLRLTDADRTAIGTALGLGRAATVAEVRTAITGSIQRAVTLINRAAFPLRRTRATGADGEPMRIRFRDAFGTMPEFVPTWRPAGQTWDIGAVVRERLRCAAKIMSEGDIEFVAWGPGSCPFAHTWTAGTWAVVQAGGYRICLGARFWRASREGDVDGLATTILHECLHIYFDTIRHRLERWPFNRAACFERYVLVANQLPVPSAVSGPCPSSAPAGDFPVTARGGTAVAGLGNLGQFQLLDAGTCPPAGFTLAQATTAVRRARAVALAILKSASSKLDSIEQKRVSGQLRSDEDKRVAKLFLFFFRHDPNHPIPWADNKPSGVNVAHRLRKAAEALVKRGLHYRCACPGAPATRRGQAAPGDTHIDLCNAFWNVPAGLHMDAETFRAGVILHEVLHVIYNTIDDAGPHRANDHCYEAFAMRAAGHGADRSDVRQCRPDLP